MSDSRFWRPCIMASELKVDKIFNAGGDQDSGINLATNDTIKFDIATSTKATMASTGIVTIVGEGGTNTTNLQQGLAKTWVNFNGTGTIAARDSFNVSGLVDNGTGDYTINFSVSMSNANYSPSGTTSVVNDGGSTPRCAITECATVAAHQIRTIVTYDSNTKLDSAIVSNQIFGDLA